MADTAPAPSSSEPGTPPSSAAEQARIRKERREAKIRAGGSTRLNKITGLGGGIQRDPPPQPSQSSHADPDEVDISKNYYETSNSNRTQSARATNSSSFTPSQTSSSQQNSTQHSINDDALRQMMLGFDPASSPPGSKPFAGFSGMGGPPGAAMPGMEGMGPPGDDPMMKLLQQMMGGMPQEGAGGMPTFPGMAEMPGMPGQAKAAADPYAYLWRIIHAVFALSLGLYITFTTTFTGTKFERDREYIPLVEEEGLNAASVRFFWIFATAEVLLQTSRFYLEKGKVQPTGIMGMVMGFLPEPWKGYLNIVLRYSRIWTTVSEDAMVCVFVLGVCSWLRYR